MMMISRFSLLFSVGLLALSSCGEQQPASSLITVKTAVVQPLKPGSPQEFPFIAQPYRTSDLSFRVGGPVMEMDIHAGNYYRQGQTIATIDPRDFEVRRIRTEAIAKQAKEEYLRIEALHRVGNIAASVYDKASADNTTAATAHQTAMNELNDTRLRAPFSGYIQDIYFERYQDIRPGQPICSLIDIERLKIETFVPQQIALTAQQRREVTLRFDARPDTVYRASVADISKGTSKNNLSFVLTVILNNKDHRLLSGMSGKLYFEGGKDEPTQGVSVPRSAVRNRPGTGDYLYIVTPSNTVERRSIRLGSIQPGGMVEVLQGVTQGETVATSGCDQLTDGQTIRLFNAQTDRP